MNMYGYETKTTFWNDFTIAERESDKAINDTYKRAMKEWKNNVVYVTELCMVLNWKCWDWYDRGKMLLSQKYTDLYYKCREWCLDHLKDADLRYFLETTD